MELARAAYPCRIVEHRTGPAIQGQAHPLAQRRVADPMAPTHPRRGRPALLFGQDREDPSSVFGSLWSSGDVRRRSRASVRARRLGSIMMMSVIRAVQSSSACSRERRRQIMRKIMRTRPDRAPCVGRRASASDLRRLRRGARPAEILIVHPHAVEDDRHSPGQGHLRPTRSLSSCDPHRPCLHGGPARGRTQDDVGRLVKRRARLATADLGDPACHVELPDWCRLGVRPR